jgi:hypothetical protein
MVQKLMEKNMEKKYFVGFFFINPQVNKIANVKIYPLNPLP